MGARSSDINPTCWAVKGIYRGAIFDGINALPLLEQEKIVFTLTSEAGDLVNLHEAPFPAHEHTKERFLQITKQIVGQKLHLLL